jgi:hypothetical protein
VASDPTTRLSNLNLNLNLRILACSGAAVHLRPKINRWAASVWLISSPTNFESFTYHTTGSTGGFGTSSNTGSTGLFGQANNTQQQQQPASTGLFAQNQPAGGAFGGGTFGTCYTIDRVAADSFWAGANTAGQKPSIFGQTQQQPATGGGFGLFGSQQQQGPQGQAQQGTTGLFGNQPGFGQPNTTQTGQPQQGGCTLLFTNYFLDSTNPEQYLAIPRLNSLPLGCSVILGEAVCLGTHSSKVHSSKLVSHPPLGCLETKQPLQQREAEFLATILPAKWTRPLRPNKQASSETRLDSQLPRRRTTPLEAETAFLGGRPQPLV